MGIQRCLLLGSLVATVLSYVSAQQTSNLIGGQCVETYDANVDYFPDKVSTSDDTASLFTIEYFKNYKLVTDTRSASTYALVQCGTPTPSDLPAGTEVYQVPVTKVAALQTTVVPYIEMLGEVDTIAYVELGSFVASSCFQNYLSAGKISEVSVTNMTLQAAQLETVQVQFGADPSSSEIANTSVTTDSSYEDNVLGRSTWLSYYAAFYNTEATANEITNSINTNYANLKKAAASYNPKPVVAWTTYNAPDQYNNNTASWAINVPAYKIGVVADAGGQALAPETTTFSNSADFLKAIANVDVIIDETYIATNLTDILENYQIPQSDVSKYKFLTNQAVFREDGILTQTGGFDWFEAPVVMADALLEDIIHAVNPSAPTADYKHNWIRNVAKAETISYIDSASCTWEENEKRPNMAVTFTGGQFAQPSYVSTSTTTTSGASTSSISSSLKIGSLGATIIAVSLMFM